MSTVPSVRRAALMITAMMTMAVLAVALPAPPAAAHFCASPALIEPGEPSTITVGVAAEADAVVDVAVTVPVGFELDEVLGAEGWTHVEEGDIVRFTGGAIAPFGCGYFLLAGVAEQVGKLVFVVEVTDETGTVLEYTGEEFGDPSAAQVIYVGSEDGGSNDDGGLAAWQVALIGVLGVAVLGGAIGVGRHALRLR